MNRHEATTHSPENKGQDIYEKYMTGPVINYYAFLNIPRDAEARTIQEAINNLEIDFQEKMIISRTLLYADRKVNYDKNLAAEEKKLEGRAKKTRL